jgi:hypothetical protein
LFSGAAYACEPCLQPGWLGQKWAVETDGHRIPIISRGFQRTWAWPGGASYEVAFNGDGIQVYEDGNLRVSRSRRRWEFDGLLLDYRASGCAAWFRVESGPLVLWLRAGPFRDHALIYPFSWHDRLPLLCGMAMAALGNYEE